jgi:hypothetical protein
MIDGHMIHDDHWDSDDEDAHIHDLRRSVGTEGGFPFRGQASANGKSTSDMPTGGAGISNGNGAASGDVEMATATAVGQSRSEAKADVSGGVPALKPPSERTVFAHADLELRHRFFLREQRQGRYVLPEKGFGKMGFGHRGFGKFQLHKAAKEIETREGRSSMERARRTSVDGVPRSKSPFPRTGSQTGGRRSLDLGSRERVGMRLSLELTRRVSLDAVRRV